MIVAGDSVEVELSPSSATGRPFAVSTISDVWAVVEQ
jgi:hypothetical protein